MLYILRHWNELHARLQEQRKLTEELSARLLAEKRLRQKAVATKKKLERLAAKYEAQAGDLALRLAKSREKVQRLAEELWLMKLKEAGGRRGVLSRLRALLG